MCKLDLTGGTEVALHMLRKSEENFGHGSVGLGGKSPMLIFEDCNIDGAVNGIIAGNFGASGQSCVAGSRVFIQRSIHSQIIDKIKERAKNIVVGDPLDSDTQVGPLATKHQVERALSVVKQSINQGANLIFGGDKPSHRKEGWYFEPTLLDCPNQEFDCVKTELFAPVISVIAFDTEADVIVMANDSAYGLGAGVFTENLARAHRVSEKIQSGIVWINTYRAISPIAPFGGVKQSGGCLLYTFFAADYPTRRELHSV